MRMLVLIPVPVITDFLLVLFNEESPLYARIIPKQVY